MLLGLKRMLMKKYISIYEEQAYQAGRQARKEDYPLLYCDLHSNDPERCWWLAGWHDQDIEFGVMVYADKTM